MSFRVVTWNCRRASPAHALWRYLVEMSPDVAVLQEVTGLPQDVCELYDVLAVRPQTKAGKLQRFQSVILARGTIADPVPLYAGIDWVDRELERFRPNLLAHRVGLRTGESLTVVGVYSPAWPVARERLTGHDVRGVKLSQNPDVWVTDLLVAALRERSDDGAEWIVAGDFNACETFDNWRGGPRGNREWLERMASLGFTECLRHYQGALTPTFRRPGVELPRSQIDHVFVSRGLAARQVRCSTGDPSRVFGGGLSDHLPILADFRDAPRAV